MARQHERRCGKGIAGINCYVRILSFLTLLISNCWK